MGHLDRPTHVAGGRRLAASSPSARSRPARPPALARPRRRRPRLAGEGLLGALADDPHQPPPLRLRQRPGLHDLDRVADVRLVLLVVDVADGPLLDVLAVLRVLDQPLDLDPAGLVHLVARDDADLRLAAVAGGVGVVGRRLAHRGLPGSMAVTAVAGRGGGRPFSFDLALAEDRLDPGDLALRLADLARASPAARSPTGSAAGTGSCSVSFSGRSSCSSLMLAEFGGLAHRRLRIRPIRARPDSDRSAAGSRTGSGTASCTPRGPGSRGPPPRGRPPISNRIVPGLTTAAQYSGSPLPLPMRVSAGIDGHATCAGRRGCTAGPRRGRLGGGDAARLDRLGAEPAALERLQAEVAERDVVAAGGVTSYAASLAFSELDPLGHHAASVISSVFR